MVHHVDVLRQHEFGNDNFDVIFDASWMRASGSCREMKRRLYYFFRYAFADDKNILVRISGDLFLFDVFVFVFVFVSLPGG